MVGGDNMYVGSWEYAQMKACKLPSEVAKVFVEATHGLSGVTYVPVLYVGSQLAAGMNYMIICKSLTLTQPTVEGCKKVMINKPIYEKAKIVSVTDIIGTITDTVESTACLDENDEQDKD